MKKIEKGGYMDYLKNSLMYTLIIVALLILLPVFSAKAYAATVNLSSLDEGAKVVFDEDTTLNIDTNKRLSSIEVYNCVLTISGTGKLTIDDNRFNDSWGIYTSSGKAVINSGTIKIVKQSAWGTFEINGGTIICEGKGRSYFRSSSEGDSFTMNGGSLYTNGLSYEGLNNEIHINGGYIESDGSIEAIILDISDNMFVVSPWLAEIKNSPYESISHQIRKMIGDYSYTIDKKTIIVPKSEVIFLDGISFNKTVMSLDIGESTNLSLQFTPANATNKSYTVESSNSSVVCVNKNNGTVSACNYGEAIITATSEDGNKIAQCKIVVVDNRKSIEAAIVKLNHTIYSYTGSEKKPRPTVTLDGTTLIEGVDYDVTYANNLDVGTAQVIISGIGDYKGTISQSFQILEYGSGMDIVFDGERTIATSDLVFTIMDDGDDPEIEVTTPRDKKAKRIVVPATVILGDKEYRVTSIGEKAFYKNKNVQEIIVGNNVENIESYAFYGCINLKKLTIGNGVQVIGDSAIRKCTKLESITLPKSLEVLGPKALYGCKKLTDLKIKSNHVIDIKVKAITNISEKAIIRVPKKLIKKYQKKFNKKTGYKNTMVIKRY